ncbi:hypothetical protein HDV05_007453, partial [Chytridiales sp. JEL 0842]
MTDPNESAHLDSSSSSSSSSFLDLLHSDTPLPDAATFTPPSAQTPTHSWADPAALEWNEADLGGEEYNDFDDQDYEGEEWAGYDYDDDEADPDYEEEEDGDEYAENEVQDDVVADVAEGDGDYIPGDIGRMMDDAAREFRGSHGQPLSYTQILQGPQDDEDGQDDDPDDVAEEMQMMGFDEPGMDKWISDGQMRKQKKKKRGGAAAKKNQHTKAEVTTLMGKANMAYANRNHKEALELLHEALRLEYSAADAWRLLAVVHDELGDWKKAMQANFLAAHLTPKDSELWHRLGKLSVKMNNIADALYCYTRAVKANHDDLQSLFERSMIYSNLKWFQKAIDGFNGVLEGAPHNIPTIRELSRIYFQLKEYEKAIALYEAAMEADRVNPLYDVSNEEDDEDIDEHDDGMPASRSESKRKPQWKPRVGYEELHFLAELYIEAKEYERALFALRSGLHRIKRAEISEDPNSNVEVGDVEFDENIAVPVELKV